MSLNFFTHKGRKAWTCFLKANHISMSGFIEYKYFIHLLVQISTIIDLRSKVSLYQILVGQ